MNKKITYKEYKAFIARKMIEGTKIPNIDELVLEYLSSKGEAIIHDEITHAISDITLIEVSELRKVVSNELKKLYEAGKVESSNRAYWKVV